MAKQNNKTRAETPTMSAFAGASGEAMKETMDRAKAFSGNMGELTRSNMEAVKESLQITGKGLSEMNTRAFGFMQANFQRNMEAVRTLSGMKSKEDFSALQGMSQASFQACLDQANEMSTLFAETLQASAAPLSAQAEAVSKTFQTPA